MPVRHAFASSFDLRSAALLWGVLFGVMGAACSVDVDVDAVGLYRCESDSDCVANWLCRQNVCIRGECEQCWAEGQGCEVDDDSVHCNQCEDNPDCGPGRDCVASPGGMRCEPSGTAGGCQNCAGTCVKQNSAGAPFCVPSGDSCNQIGGACTDGRACVGIERFENTTTVGVCKACQPACSGEPCSAQPTTNRTMDGTQVSCGCPNDTSPARQDGGTLVSCLPNCGPEGSACPSGGWCTKVGLAGGGSGNVCVDCAPTCTQGSLTQCVIYGSDFANVGAARAASSCACAMEGGWYALSNSACDLGASGLGDGNGASDGPPSIAINPTAPFQVYVATGHRPVTGTRAQVVHFENRMWNASGGGELSAGGSADPGTALDPELAIRANGSLLATWSQDNDGDRRVYVAQLNHPSGWDGISTSAVDSGVLPCGAGTDCERPGLTFAGGDPVVVSRRAPLLSARVRSSGFTPADLDGATGLIAVSTQEIQPTLAFVSGTQVRVRQFGDPDWTTPTGDLVFNASAAPTEVAIAVKRSDGQAAVAWLEGTAVRVLRRVGTEWQGWGGNPTEPSRVDGAGPMDIIWRGEQVFVAFRDAGNQISVFDMTTSPPTSVAGGTLSSSAGSPPRLALGKAPAGPGDALCVAYNTVSGPRRQTYVRCLNLAP